MPRRMTLTDWTLAIVGTFAAALMLAIGIAGAAVEIVKFLFYLFSLIFLLLIVLTMLRRRW